MQRAVQFVGRQSLSFAPLAQRSDVGILRSLSCPQSRGFVTYHRLSTPCRAAPTLKTSKQFNRRRPDIPDPFKIDVVNQPVIEAEPISRTEKKTSASASDSSQGGIDRFPDFSSTSNSFVFQKDSYAMKRRLLAITIGISLGVLIGRKRAKPRDIDHGLPSADTVEEELKVKTETKNKNETKKSALSIQPMNTYLPAVTDAVFDTTDNLCVIWVNSIKQLEERKPDVLKFIEYVKSLKLPVDVQFLYSVRSTPLETHDDENIAEHERNALTVVVYKGQRKYHFFAHTEPTASTQEIFDLQTHGIKDFFNPISEENFPFTEIPFETHSIESDSNISVPVESVTFNTFSEKVINASSAQSPIILQLMEDSCFLCFLIRPFINSISKVLKDCNVPVTIKRFNLDRNDFVPECPVVRSTPTFIEYKGPESVQHGPPQPWKEYKPKDLIAKLSQEFNLSVEVRQKLETLEEKMQDRFQKFGLLSIWNQELIGLQAFHAGELLPSQEKSESGSSAIDDQYNEIVSELMREDIRRADCLDENLEYLEKEIAAVESDCVAYAHIIGQKLFDVEGRFDLIKARLLFDAEQGKTATKIEGEVVTQRTNSEKGNIEQPNTENHNIADFDSAETLMSDSHKIAETSGAIDKEVTGSNNDTTSASERYMYQPPETEDEKKQ